MIPIYSTSGELMLALSHQDLLKSPSTIKTILHSNLLDCQSLLLLDSSYQPLPQSSTTAPKLAVILTTEHPTFALQPLRFFLKRTDRRGAVIKCHPLVTVDELAGLGVDALKIPADDQRLFFNGGELEDSTLTLLQLGVLNNSVVHVLDTRTLAESNHTKFTVELQGAKYPSKTVAQEITGATKLKELKQKASELYDIPIDKVVVAYCSVLLEDDEASLSELNIVENSQIKILDDRESVIEKVQKKDKTAPEEGHMLRAMHRATSKDSRRQPPNFIIRRTDSVEWYEYRNFSQRKPQNETGGSRCHSEMGKKEAEDMNIKKKLEDFKIDVLQSKSEYVSESGGSGRDIPAARDSIQPSEEVPVAGNSMRGSMGSSNEQAETKPQYRVQSAPRPTSRPAEFEVNVQDFEGNHFKVLINELDTVRDVKNKLYVVNPGAQPDKQMLIYDGKTLEDEQIVGDIASTQISSLFLMKREVM